MKSLRTYHKQNRQKLEFNIIYMFANYEYGFIAWIKNSGACVAFFFQNSISSLKTRVDPDELDSNEAS